MGSSEHRTVRLYVTNMNGETENAKARRDEGRKKSGERQGRGRG